MSERPALDSERPLAFERECQICGRGIAVRSGRVAPHGYQRPGDGLVVVACYGSDSPPFDQSRSAIPGYVTVLETHRGEIEVTLRRARAGGVSVPAPAPPVKTRARGPARIVAGMPGYDEALAAHILGLERTRDAIDVELARLRSRYDAWAGITSLPDSVRSTLV